MNGLTAEEKEKQISENESKVEEKQVDDSEILHPDNCTVKIGERSYTIRPPKMKEIKYLAKLSKVQFTDTLEDETVDAMIDALSVLLKEKDKEYLESNLDIPTLIQVCQVLEKVTYASIPLPRKGETPKGKQSGV